MAYFLKQQEVAVHGVRSIERVKKKQWRKIQPFLHNLTCNISNDFELLSSGRVMNCITHSDINLVDEVNASIVPRPKSMWLLCMDERIQYLAGSHRALSFGLPGCECLVCGDDKQRLLEQLVQVSKDYPSIEEIIVTSHSSCGAVNAAINKDTRPLHKALNSIFSKNEQYTDLVAKNYANEFAQKISKYAESKGVELTIRTLHLDKEQMHCPCFHNAVGAVVNYIQNLNVSELEESLDLPLFNIYAQAQSPDLVLKNIELAIGIAEHDHGFGSFFSEESPFVLVFTGDSLEIDYVISELRKKQFNIPVALTHVKK